MRDIYEARILVVEDDPTLRAQLLGLLGREGYRNVHGSATVADTLFLASTWQPHLYLLDVMLPDGNGFDLLRRLHETSNAPALFLSARDEDASRLRGLGLGADDYVTKPFLPAELLLRIAAVLRRSYRLPEVLPTIVLGKTTVDLATGEVHRAGSAVATLTAKEHALIKRLSESRDLIVTTDELCRSVYGDAFGYANALAILMRRLREKIEDDPSHPYWVVTVRGLGYRLVNEDTQ